MHTISKRSKLLTNLISELLPPNQAASLLGQTQYHIVRARTVYYDQLWSLLGLMSFPTSIIPAQQWQNTWTQWRLSY